LLDLKHLLIEAKQTVPDFLRILEDDQQFENHGSQYFTYTFITIVLDTIEMEDKNKYFLIQF